ncbi:MAG: hypothetical protein ACPGWR_20090 [Ardenticatenaceae bacterium]
MNQSSRIPIILISLVECVRLLYWTYFKPFSLAQWLENIHPKLKQTSNPFAKPDGFVVNLSLQRYYAKQVLSLNLLLPLLVILLVPPLYSMVTGTPFDWLINAPFLANWAMLLWIGGLLGCILSGLAFGMAFGITFGMAFGMALAMVAGVEFTLESGVLLGALFGLAFGLACGQIFDIPNGVALGMPISMIGGIITTIAANVEFGLAFGLASSIAWILAILRLYFWLPEFLWMILLTLLTPSAKRGERLHYLPLWYDELIYLPLPFINQWIIDAYRKNPVEVRHLVKYLLSSTNQQELAHQTIVNIALDRLKGSQNLNDLIMVRNELSWIYDLPISTESILPTFLHLRHEIRPATNGTSNEMPSHLGANHSRAWHNLPNPLTLSQEASDPSHNQNIAQQFNILALEPSLESDFLSDSLSGSKNLEEPLHSIDQDTSTCTLPPIAVVMQNGAVQAS